MEIPAEIRPTGQYAQFIPQNDDIASVTYVGLSGVDPIPSAFLRDPRAFLLDTRGLATGRYKFVAVASGKTGEQTRSDFEIVKGTPPIPDPTPDPKPDPPPDPKPDPKPVGGLFALVVYEAQNPVTPEMRAIWVAPEIREYTKRRYKMLRFFDRNQNIKAEHPAIRNLFEKYPSKGDAPWLLIGDEQGTVLYDAVLPPDVASLMAVLQKFGGQ